MLSVMIFTLCLYLILGQRKLIYYSRTNIGLFDKIKEPVILKEDSSARDQLKKLEKLLMTVNDSKIKTMLEKDIAAVNAGIFGEDTILFELKNSHIPMFVLHDLFLQYEGLSAQIGLL